MIFIEVLKSILCYYGDITTTAVHANQVASKNCATFTKCIRKIDGTIKDNQKLSKFYIK